VEVGREQEAVFVTGIYAPLQKIFAFRRGFRPDFADKFCLIEVCLIWGGRSIPLGQGVLEPGSATVGFEQYRPVLETVVTVLPDNCRVTLLADRGFEHGALIRWLRERGWSWCIRAKSDLYQISKFLTDIELLKSKTIPLNTR